MDTDALADRLARDDATATATVAAFPDGSVDAFCRVAVDGERIATREAFADAVGGGADAFSLDRTAIEPGGHATNLAIQADALGERVTLAGHLDDPAFADLPFEAVSMGDPSRVSVYGFDDADLLGVEESAAVGAWTLSDLRGALGDRFRRFLTADAVCCTNWTAVDALPDALSSIADAVEDRSDGSDGADREPGLCLVDTGSIAGRSDREIGDLFDALADLSGAYETVIAGNDDEVTAMAGALRGPAADDASAALATLRDRADLSAAVVHDAERAAAATRDGVVTVGNFDVTPTRYTGGGDRFDAGLAFALARGWEWRAALGLGNACASRYVATGETGGPAELAAFLRERA